MKYNDLKATVTKSRKRVGRGIAAGQGKTAGRGTKGQGARTGSSKRPGFEGGQNPLMQRLPKLVGFKSKQVRAENVFTDQLDKLGAKVDNEALAKAGLVSSAYVRVKLLKRGDVTKKVTVELQAASETAIEAIQKAGGEFKAVARTPRPVTKKKEDK
ncbi:MAG TPA: 50S ribosomal protein L15 [Candidatus Saccharimonadales bacterium]|nr:50S ribosomal protein L15 [Candidatus Saccharimonadales bacterium]